MYSAKCITQYLHIATLIHVHHVCNVAFTRYEGCVYALGWLRLRLRLVAFTQSKRGIPSYDVYLSSDLYCTYAQWYMYQHILTFWYTIFPFMEVSLGVIV